MPKRKKARKLETQHARAAPRAAAGQKGNATPVPAFLFKGLAIFLSALLVIALTLYVLGRMPARGFWTLAIILAVIAFFVLPWMRKRFAAI